MKRRIKRSIRTNRAEQRYARLSRVPPVGSYHNIGQVDLSVANVTLP
jgi:hypothetical protein